MTIAISLIPGVDQIIRRGDRGRRSEAARRIADLFFEDAAKLRPEHINLFDGLLIALVPHTDVIARIDLAERLSRLDRAPRILVRQLAREDEIMVAGPLLRRSPVLDETCLIEIARDQGQDHLLAMSERPTLSADVTDILICRGDRDVVRRAAGNGGARFSEFGYSELVSRASFDGVLTLTVGKRHDLSDAHLKTLVSRRSLLGLSKWSGDGCLTSSSRSARPRSRRQLRTSMARQDRSRAPGISSRLSAPFWRSMSPAASTKARCSALREAINMRRPSPRWQRCRV